ncbi:hypothetical protein OEA41_007828 [Lepraria neglecta]|uniref:Mediator of RNA polymerase II transcription subunit 21 n=1 Tax=Lepraria neglecta TaxID=209136 RepID=A0AAE0DQP9_9LECA|nr:hypothetical protein OEA41_007828 [Lepraria neglecta]
MADRLTQLQDCYDQLATQFYASIRYISLHHNASALPAPVPLPTTSSTSGGANGQIARPNSTTNTQQSQAVVEPPDPSSLPPEQRPDTPTTFAVAQKELAHDLILKTRQIEYLIGVLPGIGEGQESQEERIRRLDGELRGALEERRVVERERERWVGLMEGVVGGVRR